ncbi:MAG TPA: glycosyl hydrolase family 18 protein [Ilumatobacteraceae bacterium]|nr:glycosyl hydrolase family 18 protein [Ilumatobacteraceae bacterium]
MLAVVVVGAAATAVSVAVDDEPPPRPDIPLDTWVPYWTVVDALPIVERRGPSMREISPFWFTATADAILLDPNASPDATAQFLEAARRTGADIVPSIVDNLPAGTMAALLADPVTRRRHVEAIRSFAADGDFRGIDIDYEQFAFADGRDTWATTRPNWVAFIEELGAALRADGRTLTVSIPPVYDDGQTAESGFWVYDYGAIVDHVDRIRMMTYDFSVQEPGPIAPLEWVETAITGAIEATGSPDKLVLGLPAYGRNWVVATVGTCPADAPGRTAVTAQSVDDLVALRGATPTRVEETGEWTFEYELEVADETTSCVQTRRVHYVDADGIRERMDLARRYRLDGVALWALGFDDDDVWEAILPTVADPGGATTLPGP